MADYLNLRVRHLDSTDLGGCSYIAHVAHAAEAIAAGRCSVALITLAGRPRSEGHSGTNARRWPRQTCRTAAWEAPFGPDHAQRVCDVRGPPHAPVRHHLRTARLDQGRRQPPRPAQPARHAARRGDGGGGGELPHDHRPPAPPRLLRGQRRRRRPDRHQREHRPRPQSPAGPPDRRRGGVQGPDGRRGGPDLFRRRLVRPGGVRHGGRDPGGHPIRLHLRQLHHHRADAAGRPRLLRQGRGRPRS